MRHSRLWPSLLVLLLATAARGEDERFRFMAKELSGADDPRSRALAALMLGATQDPAAEPPLCRALADGSELVRAAAARALGQVHAPDAERCLSAHAQDASPNVRDAVARAEQALALQAQRPPFLYVAFAAQGDAAASGTAVADSGVLLQIAEASARRRLAVLGARFAPAGEPAAEAIRREQEAKLRGVSLSFSIERRGDALRLTLRCTAYPDGAFIGREVLSAGHAGDEALVRGLAARAVDLAAADFNWRP